MKLDYIKKQAQEALERLKKATPVPWSDFAIGRFDEYIVSHSEDALKVVADCKTMADAEFISKAPDDIHELAQAVLMMASLIEIAIPNCDGVMVTCYNKATRACFNGGSYCDDHSSDSPEEFEEITYSQQLRALNLSGSKTKPLKQSCYKKSKKKVLR